MTTTLQVSDLEERVHPLTSDTFPESARPALIFILIWAVLA